LGCNEEITDADEDEDEEDSDEKEEEAECSAPRCKRPIADAISWVQCDICQEWFHCNCVGLTKEYAEKIDKYNCRKCVDRGHKSGSAGGVAAARGGSSYSGHGTSSSRSAASNSGAGAGAGDRVGLAGRATSSSAEGRGMKTTSSPARSSESSTPSSRASTTTQELVKGILQNPQLAAQLLSSIPPLK
jgi:hypothetical protein